MDLPSSLPAEDITRAMSSVATTRFSQRKSHSSQKRRTQDWFCDLPISASTWAIDQLMSLDSVESGYSKGRLLVGIGQDHRRRQKWLHETLSLWQDRVGTHFGNTLQPPKSCNGKEIAKELHRARASGSLEAFRKSLTSGQIPILPNPSKTDQRPFPHCILVDRLDRAGTREDDLLLLCQLIDALLNSPTLLVVTLPSHPSTLHLHPALESRLEAGLIIPLVHGEKSSATSLSGLQRHRRLTLEAPDLSDEKALRPKAKISKRPPTIRRIISAVARYCDVDAEDIIGSSQRRCHVRPRGLVIHCAHLLTDKSSHAIGKAIGGRDHTTVLHSLKVTTRLIQHEPGYAGDLDAIIEQLAKQNRSR